MANTISPVSHRSWNRASSTPPPYTWRIRYTTRVCPRCVSSVETLTNFWVNFEVGCGKIKDSMIGFRIYPLAAMSLVAVKANRMDFDIEVAVKLAWAKTPLINLPVPVRYLSAEEGGVSHFSTFLGQLQVFSLAL